MGSDVKRAASRLARVGSTNAANGLNRLCKPDKLCAGCCKPAITVATNYSNRFEGADVTS